MKDVTDKIGTYQMKTTNKLINEDDYSKIYFNLFDNGEKENASRYKVNLLFTDDSGNQRTFIAPILNHFEPARWLRNIPVEYREFAFYRQILETNANLKKDPVKFEKKFSAGFFHESVEDAPTLNTAIAFGFIEDGTMPMFGFRFWDFTWFGELELSGLNKKNSPKWSKSIKCEAKARMFDGWA